MRNWVIKRGRRNQHNQGAYCAHLEGIPAGTNCFTAQSPLVSASRGLPTSVPKAHLEPYSESCNSSEYHSPGAPWGGLVGTDSGSQAIKKGTVHTSPQRGTSRKPFCSPRVCESTSKILEPYTASLMEDSDDGLNQTQKKKNQLSIFKWKSQSFLHALKHSK